MSRTIDAPVGAVWAVVTDLDNAESVLSGVEKLERLDSTKYEVGTRWRETRVLFGKSSTEEMWVTEIDPEKRTVRAGPRVAGRRPQRRPHAGDRVPAEPHAGCDARRRSWRSTWRSLQAPRSRSRRDAD